MYLNGLGVKKDYIYAYMWWKIAKSSGDKIADKNIVVVTQKMTSDQILKADKLATEFLNKKR
jgi:TPR repeat protein